MTQLVTDKQRYQAAWRDRNQAKIKGYRVRHRALRLLKSREETNRCVICGLTLQEPSYVCGFCLEEAQGST